VNLARRAGARGVNCVESNCLFQGSQYVLVPGKSRGPWICPMNKPSIDLATLEFLGVCVLLAFTQWGTLSWGTFTPSRLPKPRL
jgi:hypothetical protein